MIVCCIIISLPADTNHHGYAMCKCNFLQVALKSSSDKSGKFFNDLLNFFYWFSYIYNAMIEPLGIEPS